MKHAFAKNNSFQDTHIHSDSQSCFLVRLINSKIPWIWYRPCKLEGRWKRFGVFANSRLRTMRLFSNKGRPRRHRSTSKARRANHNARVDSEVNWCPELQPFTVASCTLAVKSQRRCSDKERPRLLRKPIHNALVNSEMKGLAAFESFTVANGNRVFHSCERQTVSGVTGSVHVVSARYSAI